VSIEFLPLPAIGFATEPLPTRDGFLGIEFYGDRPKVWYPGTNKHISIILTDSAREDPPQAVFQLAHEVVHILSPTGGANAPVVEEGLSALFQERANEIYGLNLRLVSKPYIKAFIDFETRIK